MELGFMQAKLVFVFLLYAYHLFCHKLFKELQSGRTRWTSTQLRLWNEASTLLLFTIVFLIVLKDTIQMVWGISGLITLGISLTIGIRIYKKFRKNA
jgi:putative membrane protein